MCPYETVSFARERLVLGSQSLNSQLDQVQIAILFGRWLSDLSDVLEVANYALW